MHKWATWIDKQPKMHAPTSVFFTSSNYLNYMHVIKNQLYVVFDGNKPNKTLNIPLMSIHRPYAGGVAPNVRGGLLAAPGLHDVIQGLELRRACGFPRKVRWQTSMRIPSNFIMTWTAGDHLQTLQALSQFFYFEELSLGYMSSAVSI